MPQFWIIVLTIGIILSLMFKQTWILIGNLFVVGFHVLKWVIIFSLIFGLCNSQQAFDEFGFTPISVMFGDTYYKKRIKK